MVNKKKVAIKTLSDEISMLKEMIGLKKMVAEITKTVQNLEKDTDI